MRPDSRTLQLNTALAIALLMLCACFAKAQTAPQAVGACEATPPTWAHACLGPLSVAAEAASRSASVKA